MNRITRKTTQLRIKNIIKNAQRELDFNDLIEWLVYLDWLNRVRSMKGLKQERERKE